MSIAIRGSSGTYAYSSLTLSRGDPGNLGNPGNLEYDSAFRCCVLP
jgi:hypothetical protein